MAVFTSSVFALRKKLIMDALVKAKPASAKGQYFKSVTLTNTMGPGIKVSPLKYA